MFYGNEAIISGIEQVRGDFIVKLHIGKLNSEQLARAINCVDRILYCRRDLDEVLAAYRRGEKNGIYPNLYGKEADSSETRQMKSYLLELDDYWSATADEIIEFSQLTSGRALTVMQNLYDVKNFPKERFSRGKKQKSESQFMRIFALNLEKLLSLTGVNVLYLRRFFLGKLGKY